MNVGVFLLVEFLVAVVFLSVGGILIYRCRASGEWQPRELLDAEHESGIEDKWR